MLNTYIITTAIRIFRTAHELSLHTIAVFSYEDRLSMHRQKADEAYAIGKRGQYTPVGAYLAGDEIIKIALEHGAQMIHPGKLIRVDAFLARPTFTNWLSQVMVSCQRTPNSHEMLRRMAWW